MNSIMGLVNIEIWTSIARSQKRDTNGSMLLQAFVISSNYAAMQLEKDLAKVTKYGGALICARY